MHKYLQLSWQCIKLFRGHAPGQLVIQMTDRCNASCPQCGMHVSASFKRTTLPMDDLKRIIDHAAQRGVKALSFTGGEPLLLLENLAELLNYAGRAGIPYLRTGTNGFFLKEPEKGDFIGRVKRVVNTLANTPLRNLWISLDSAIPEVHEKMRGIPGVISGIEKALPIFHDAGIYPAANLGMNRMLNGCSTNGLYPNSYASRDDYLNAFYAAFTEGITRFYGRVLDLGFTMSNTCYPMSTTAAEARNGTEAVYPAASSDRIVCFDRDEKAALFNALLTVIPKYRNRIRIFSPYTSLYSLQKHYAEGRDTRYPCRGGYDFFFVGSADGDTYPCGYRGSQNLGKFWNLQQDKIDRKPECTQCDWECFRDPSELIGPLEDCIKRPWRLACIAADDPAFIRMWLNDVRYYIACGFFDGRKPFAKESALGMENILYNRGIA